MPIFHFQILGPLGWEAIGAGVGQGEDPLGGALDELRDHFGGELPPGRYQALEAWVSDACWTEFEIAPDGVRLGLSEPDED